VGAFDSEHKATTSRSTPNFAVTFQVVSAWLKPLCGQLSCCLRWYKRKKRRKSRTAMVINIEPLTNEILIGETLLP
jgi:hypothetical protein